MKKRSHVGQYGFSAVEVTIVLFVLATLSLGGWWVANNHAKPQTLKQATHSQTTLKTQSTEQAADPTEGGKYLVIKEWGVRFRVPAELQGQVSYEPDLNTQNSYFVETSSAAGRNQCSSFSLVRTTSKQDNPTDPQGFTSTSVAHIGSYYFSRVTGVIACSNDKQVEKDAANIQKQLYDASASLEAY